MTKDTFTESEQKKGSLRLLLLISLLLVVGGGLLAWQFFTRQTPQASNISTNPHFNATAQSSPSASKGTPPEVVSVVRQQVAQQLHLSVAQLVAKLQAGVAIETLAAQQGMSADAWRTFVIATYQAAYNQAVSAGQLTQANADHDMHNIRSYPSDALNGWVTNDCLSATTE
ncbi:MAG TPA: hypothetical protein VGD98_17055 [Ktedonobacteraceae bacterium]